MGRRVIRFAVYANGSILVRMDENRSEWDDRPVRRPLFVPAGGPPRVNPPSLEIYAAMGEDNIYRMVADFYHELEHSPIRFMFPANMQDAAEKTSAFFVGLLGGPPLYHQRYGPPALRARHLPYPIDEAARQEWLACFQRTLSRAVADYNFPAQHLEGFHIFLRDFSVWMVNIAPDGQ